MDRKEKGRVVKKAGKAVREVIQPDARVLDDWKPIAFGVFVFPLLTSKYGKGKVRYEDENRYVCRAMEK